MQMTKYLLVAALCLAPFVAQGQIQQAQGKGTVTYQGPAAPPAAKQAALRKAQMNAFDFYYAEAGEAESDNYAKVKDQIFQDLDRYVLDTTTLSVQDDPASQTYTVAVRIAMNVPNLRNLMKQNSAVGAALKGQKSRLAFLFVSRQVDSVKTFDARVYKRTDTSAQAQGTAAKSEVGAEGEAVGASNVTTTAAKTTTGASSANSSATIETGGSTTRKAKEQTWRIAPSQDLNQVFAQVFTKAGFRVQEATLVEAAAGGKFKVAAVEEDYKSGNDLKSTTLQSVVDGMRTASVPYIALGTLDQGTIDTDPATGLYRAVITVNARLLDVTDTIPETLASVGPVQYSGRGPTEDEARTNALKLAASSAARELSSQMNSQGLH